MSDISPTLNMIDDALGSQGPSSGVTPGGVPIGPNGIPQVNITSPQPSTADQAIKLLQAGIDGKVKAPEKPYETTGKSLILNAQAGANSALASTLGAPLDLVSAGLRKIGVPIPDAPFGGSESIKHGMGLIGANPDAIQPQNWPKMSHMASVKAFAEL